MSTICILAGLINWNVGRLQARAHEHCSPPHCLSPHIRAQIHTAELASAANQRQLSEHGSVDLPTGGTIAKAPVYEATRRDGNATTQCISPHKNDVATAQCQSFCNGKYAQHHCKWCAAASRCRLSRAS
jgi:hypothetical protein